MDALARNDLLGSLDFLEGIAESRKRALNNR
jgi:hypothetical protein